MPTNGLVTMTPTSIVSSGTGNSSSINTNGSVTFSSCITLSLNGVFTTDYDNYMIVVRDTGPSGSSNIYCRFRSSGTDNSTSNSYASQNFYASSTTFAALRSTLNYGYLSDTGSSTLRSGFTAYMFGPKLAQATAWRAVTASSDGSALINTYAGTHSQTTAYDGVTLFSIPQNFSGLVTVYGFNQ